MVADNYWTPGWKVLSKRWSPCVTGSAGRHYPAWVIARPAADCGPLAVFASDEDAVRWVDEISRGKDWRDITIIACGFVGSADAGLWYPWHPDVRLSTDGVSAYPLAWCPRGTRLADAVCCWE